MLGRKRKLKMSQDEYDKAIASALALGMQMGQIDERNRWLTKEKPLTFVEKQAVVILERERF